MSTERLKTHPLKMPTVCMTDKETLSREWKELESVNAVRKILWQLLNMDPQDETPKRVILIRS